MRINIRYSLTLLSFLLTMTVTAQEEEEKINGIIALEMGANDSMHLVTGTVINATTKLPVKDIALIFYVKRTFGLMKVAEGTTDTTGVASAEFPQNIQGGDSSRIMTVVARVIDSDVMNDTTSQVVTKSKLAFPVNKPIPRSIGGSFAPWWLVITFTGAVGSVWLLFVYVLYLVYRIKKASTIRIISTQ